MPMTERDKFYICDRLFAPANTAMEALDRLERNYKTVEAEQLRVALKEFKDKCRAIAVKL